MQVRSMSAHSCRSGGHLSPVSFFLNLAAISSLSLCLPSKKVLLSLLPQHIFYIRVTLSRHVSSQVKLLPNNPDATIHPMCLKGQRKNSPFRSAPRQCVYVVCTLSFVAFTFISFASQILLITPVRNQ